MSLFFNRAGVHNSYSHKVRVGNWSEEQELFELKMKDFLYKKNTGQLLINSVENQLKSSLKSVKLTYSVDNTIKYGDHIMLYSAATSGVVSVSLSEEGGAEKNTFAVSSSTLTHGPVARNVFIVEPYGDDKTARIGFPLRYGSLFRLRLHSSLSSINPSSSPLYLTSQPVSHIYSTKLSRHQSVSFSGTKSFDSVWKVFYKNINERFEKDGKEIKSSEELIIVHAATENALYSSLKYPLHNDFGKEYQISAFSNFSIAKTQGLYAEMQGKITTDIKIRKEGDENSFAFLTASVPELDQETQADMDGNQMEKSIILKNNNVSGASSASSLSLSSNNTEKDMAVLLEEVREKILKKGLNGIHSLSKAFRQADKQHNDTITLQDFITILLSPLYGPILTNSSQAASLGLLFPPNTNNTYPSSQFIDPSGGHQTGPTLIDYSLFLSHLRGSLSLRRARYLSKIFSLLDTESTGSIRLMDLIELYHPESEPDVKEGKLTIKEKKKLFWEAFEGLTIDGGRVRKDEWFDYYSSVSTFIQNDDYFAHYLASVWRVPED